MEMVKTSFTVNPLIIEEPTYYLGSDVVKLYFEDGFYELTMVSNTYVEKSTKNPKNNLEADGFIFNKKLSNTNYSPKHHFSTTSYFPELDTSVE